MKQIWILHHSTNIDAYENKKLTQSLIAAGFAVLIVEPKYFNIIISSNNGSGIIYKGKSIQLPDLVLSRTGSGTTYGALAIMQQLETFNIPVINDSNSVRIVADKLITSQLLSKEGIPVPKTILFNDKVDIELVDKEIGFPCVVKATTGSKGNTVYLCNTKQEFKKLTDLLSSISLRKLLIIQEYIDTAPGIDIRVLVIGDKTIAAMKRTGPSGDFRANISNGGTAEQIEITEEIDFIARETARILGLQIAGIDLLFTEDGFSVCEANSSPGFSGMDKYCGTDLAGSIVSFIELILN